MGINRFECRTCPYEQPIVRQTIFETTQMKQKEVEDIFGGKEEFANADSVASKLRRFSIPGPCRISQTSVWIEAPSWI